MRISDWSSDVCSSDLPLEGGAYFEIVSLDSLESTLDTLGVSLVGASLVTTLAGAALGRWASRRALRPLTGVSTAALAPAAGRLDTRLEASEEPDPAPLDRKSPVSGKRLSTRLAPRGPRHHKKK